MRGSFDIAGILSILYSFVSWMTKRPKKKLYVYLNFLRARYKQKGNFKQIFKKSEFNFFIYPRNRTIQN